MRDLVLLCDWLPPDFGAVGQYALQYARQRASGGEDVVLYGLTSGQSSVVRESLGGDKLRIVSYGKEFPFDPGHEDAAWSKNRRAHFVITAK